MISRNFSSVILNFTGFFTLNIFLLFIFEIEICWLRYQLTYQSFCLYVHRRCMYCNFKIFLKLSSHVLQPLQQSVRDPAIKTASHHVPMKNTLQVYEFFFPFFLSISIYFIDLQSFISISPQNRSQLDTL